MTLLNSWHRVFIVLALIMGGAEIGSSFFVSDPMITGSSLLSPTTHSTPALQVSPFSARLLLPQPIGRARTFVWIVNASSVRVGLGSNILTLSGCWTRGAIAGDILAARAQAPHARAIMARLDRVHHVLRVQNLSRQFLPSSLNSSFR